MRLEIHCIGRMKSGPERELVERYLQRLSRSGGSLGIEFAATTELPESRARSVDERRRDEAARLEAGIAPDAVRLLLDETGKNLSSEDFAAWLSDQRDGGRRSLALVIGGPDGFDADFRRGADLLLSLGRMTWPHQIVRILLAEQLYRATTILAGHPYHRG